MKRFELVIVGSGIAGIGLAKAVRELSDDVTILLVTETSGDSYYKPDLSTAMSNQLTPADLIVEPCSQWSTQYNIEVMEYTQISHVDAQKKIVLVGDSEYEYHHLVLATGASPKSETPEPFTTIPHHVWNQWSDFDAFYQQAGNANTVLIVGGGMIGVELACDFALAGKNVTLISRGSLLASQLPVALSDFLRDKLSEAGVKVFTRHRIVDAQSKEHITVTLNDETQLKCDHVILATGLKARVDLAEQMGCVVRDGIVCNEYLETSMDGVYAIGDCAEINGRVDRFVAPIERCISSLALTLVTERTAYRRQGTCIFLKTPCCPVVIHEHGETPVTWQLSVDEFGATALAVSTEQTLVGFVTMGSHCRYTAKLTRKLHTPYQAELTEEIV